MIRENFITMDDRLWSPDEWAAWLRYVDGVHTTPERVEKRYETAVIGEKDSRFMKSDSEYGGK